VRIAKHPERVAAILSALFAKKRLPQKIAVCRPGEKMLSWQVFFAGMLPKQ
jgi:hypothetical protein